MAEILVTKVRFSFFCNSSAGSDSCGGKLKDELLPFFPVFVFLPLHNI